MFGISIPGILWAPDYISKIHSLQENLNHFWLQQSLPCTPAVPWFLKKWNRHISEREDWQCEVIVSAPAKPWLLKVYTCAVSTQQTNPCVEEIARYKGDAVSKVEICTPRGLSSQIQGTSDKNCAIPVDSQVLKTVWLIWATGKGGGGVFTKAFWRDNWNVRPGIYCTESQIANSWSVRHWI